MENNINENLDNEIVDDTVENETVIDLGTINYQFLNNNFINNVINIQYNMDELIENNININDYLSKIKNGTKEEVIKTLIDYPEFKHENDKFFSYPIHYICMNKNLDIHLFKYAIEIIDYYVIYSNEVRNIIYFLFKYGTVTVNILQYLYDIGFNFLFYDVYRNNLFHYLTYYKNPSTDVLIKLMEIISDINYEINTKNSISETPLILACQNNNTEIAKLLIELNANVTLKNSNNNNALMYACSFNNLELVKKLINRGADVNEVDNQGDNAFFYACGCDNFGLLNLDLIKYLYDFITDNDYLSKDKCNALHYACGFNNDTINYEVIEYLLSKGFNSDIININNETLIDLLKKNCYFKGALKRKILHLVKKFNLHKHKNINNSLILMYCYDNDFKEYLNFEDLKLENIDHDCIICKDEFNSSSRIVKCVNGHCIDFDCMLECNYNNNKNCPLCLDKIDIYKIYSLCNE